MPTVYFGIDIGDGETAVARAIEGSNAEPQVLEIRGRKNILTALGVDAGGARYIGEEAFQIGDMQRLHLRFKSLYLVDEAARQWMEEYARLLFLNLQQSGQLVDVDAAKVFVGCPAGWDDATRTAYRQLMERAGFRHVTVVSESRAALVYARESGELRVTSEQLHKPTLIVDAGSSTTDYTFVTDLQERRLHDAGEVMLGGGILDRLLLDYTINRRPDAGALWTLLETYPALLARCELEARKVKEMYFVNQKRGGERTYLNESSVKLHTDPPYRVDIVCNDSIMDALLNEKLASLNGRSYLQTYTRSLEALGRDMQVKPEIILMTGGAMHMPFMQEIAKEVFPQAAIVQGNEPEYAIARGLCYALRMEEKRAGFHRDIEAMIRSDAVETIVTDQLDQLFGKISPILVDVIADVLAPDVFERWRKGEIATLNDMVKTMANEGSDLMRSEEVNALLRPAIAQWLNLLRPKLEQVTNPICDRYGLPRTSLRLPDFVYVSTNSPLDMSTLVGFTSIKVIVDVVIASIVAVIAGGAETALIMTGPVGLLIGFIIGLIAAWVGMQFAERLVMDMNMPKAARRLFSKKMLLGRLQNKKDDMIIKLNEELSMKIQQKSEDITEMVNSIAQAIEKQLRAEMENAILLIR